MKKIVCAATMMLAAVAFSAQSASAGPLTSQKDKRLAVTTLAVGGASTGAYLAIRNKGEGYIRTTELASYGLATVGCMAISPIVGGIVTQRELTRREVHVMMANCALPIVGGWLMNAYFDANPERDSVAAAPVRKQRKHKKVAAK